MKPYGLRKHDDFPYDFGPQTKHFKVKSKNRRESRRLLHKQGRNDSKRLIDDV